MLEMMKQNNRVSILMKEDKKQCILHTAAVHIIRICDDFSDRMMEKALHIWWVYIGERASKTTKDKT